jgi:hypothetical protein
MKSSILIIILTLCLLLAANPSSAAKPNIIGPVIELINSNIIVSLSIDDTEELESVIASGIAKEIIFTVELLRVWKFWPDEFVVSKRIEKTIQYDNLREQYMASSNDGVTRTEIKYDKYSIVKNWLFSAANINLANIKELDPGRYYVRVVVESKSLEQLPFIGFLMHFIPEVEMSLAKESLPYGLEVRE